MNRTELMERAGKIHNNLTTIEIGTRNYIKNILKNLDTLDNNSIITTINLLSQHSLNSILLVEPLSFETFEIIKDTIKLLQCELKNRRS